MHLPPPAQIIVGRSTTQLLFLVGWAVAYGCVLFALSGTLPALALEALALISLVLCSNAAWRWWKTPVGVLAWNGRGWTWQQAQEKRGCELSWGADLQSLVLISTQIDAQPRQWLWVERGAKNAASWRAFRRALVAGSHAVDGGDDDGTHSGRLFNFTETAPYAVQ
jgi:hypothetical protein